MDFDFYIYHSFFRPERFLSSDGKCEQDEQFTFLFNVVFDNPTRKG